MSRVSSSYSKWSPSLALGGELEGDGGGVLAGLADDAGLGELAAGPGEGVSGRQFSGHALLQAGVTQGGDQVQVADLHAAGRSR